MSRSSLDALCHDNRIEGEPYDPTDDGFVFSNAHIDALLRHGDGDNGAARANDGHLEAA